MGVDPLVGIRRTRAPSRAERDLLLAAMGFGQAPGDPSAHVDSGVDWPFLVAYAEERCALPALADYVARSPLQHAIPKGPLAILDDAGLRNELQNRVLLRDLSAVVKVLHAAGIPSIALKGAALLAIHPQLVRSRHTDDIDLWVSEEHLVEADKVLRNEGFREFGHILAPGETGHHQLQMLVTEHGTPVEIHRRPPEVFTEGFDQGWSAAEKVEIHGVPIAIRSGPRMLIDVCAHVALHHGADPQLWPRHMVDCAALVAVRPTLWAEAYELADVPQRAALWLSRVVLAQTRRRRGGPLGDRLVFPIRSGWRGVALVNYAVRRGLFAPRALYRTLLPSLEDLNARGYVGDRPWRAHWQRIRAHLDAIRLP